MITLAIIFSLLTLVGWGIFHKPEDGNFWSENESLAVVFGGIFLVIFLVALGFVRAENTIGNAGLELIYSTTIQNYETTVIETKALLSTDSSSVKFVDGSIEKMQIASSVSERMVELRNQVNHLNKIVVSKNAWASEYLLGGFLFTPPAPKHLKPYVLK